MTAEAEEGPNAVNQRRGRRGPILLVILLLVVAAGLALWTQRRPIAAGFIERELKRRGVTARYDVAEIGPATQRLDNLVVGDPRDPDLVADRVIVHTRLTLGYPEITGIEAGRVRLRGRWIDGHLSLGAIDRLLPAPSGEPFKLPDMDVAIADGRARVETPIGTVGVKLSGRGVLSDGFRGRVALVANRLVGAGCSAVRPQAALAVVIRQREIDLSGPMRVTQGGCAGVASVRNAGIDLKLRLPEAVDRWKGQAQLTADTVAAPGAALAKLAGKLDFSGAPNATEGALDVQAEAATAATARVRNASLVGRYRLSGASVRLAGRIGAGELNATRAIDGLDLRLANGTPGVALATRLNQAVRQAAQSVSGSADIALAIDGGRGAIISRAIAAETASGATIDFAGARGLAYGWPGNRTMLDGTLKMRGGGLPDATIALSQAGPGAPITGCATIAAYAAGGESLTLAPISFSRASDGATRIETRVKASLGLPGGRVDGLALPIDLRWDGGRRLVLAPGCVDAGFDRLSLSGLGLDGTTLRLCPLGPRLLESGPAGVRAGARIVSPRLSGTLGGTALRLAASNADVRVGRRFDFTLVDVAARLGQPDRESRLVMARLDGHVVAGGAEGQFDGASGNIVNVPLDLTQGAGDWRFLGGKLALKGRALRVADAAPEARFEPLAANDFVLGLADSQIVATGTLTTPQGGHKVAGVDIGHDLQSSTGAALLKVDDLRFGDQLQPDALTKIVFGVIADVKGSVSGTGHIRWSPDGVTSTGVFRTSGTDLAAAFGPVSGLAGEIRFTDLLGLKSEAAVGTIASVNPGIPVENGEVRYRLIGDQRVEVLGGRWPFAGGAMILDPTVLDLSEGKERRMTFRVEGVDAGSFLQQFDFANLNATGTFDGVLPMIFDERGGRIENGRLAVREGGGKLAYVGEVSRENLGTWGNFAFSALKSLNYRNLNLVMNGPLDGEMVTEIRFSGVSQGEGTSSNFLIRRLARLPLVFNVTVRAPFRQLIDSVQSYYDPKRLIERNLPALLEQQKQGGVQPPASENVP